MNNIKQKYLRGQYMKGISIEERAVNLAHYIIETKDTVRGTAKKFGISKSTVHKDVTFQNGKNKICRGRSPRRPDSRKY